MPLCDQKKKKKTQNNNKYWETKRKPKGLVHGTKAKQKVHIHYSLKSLSFSLALFKTPKKKKTTLRKKREQRESVRFWNGLIDWHTNETVCMGKPNQTKFDWRIIREREREREREMSLRIKTVVDKFVEELKEALDADIQDRIMKEREMQSYIQEREREVAEREAAWKAELSRREVTPFPFLCFFPISHFSIYFKAFHYYHH